MMVAEPMPAPVTCGALAGVVKPAPMNTLAGVTTLDVSLLTKLTVTPPAGAAVDKVIDKLAVWPRLTDVLPTVIVG